MTRPRPSPDASPRPSPGERRAGAPWTATAISSAIIVAGAWFVFVLPWRIPVPTGIESVSAVVGFSNRAALVGLAATLVEIGRAHV